MSDSSNIQLLANIALFHVIGVEYHVVNRQQIRLNSENPMLLFVVGKNVRVYTRTIPYVVRTSGFFLLPAGESATIDAVKHEMEYYFVEFQTDVPQNAGRSAVRLFSENQNLRELIALFPRNSADFARRFQSLVSIWNRPEPEKDLGVLGEFYGILYEFIRQEKESQRISERSAHQDIVERTREYLDCHYAEVNSIQMLAEVMGVGRTTLYEQFRSRTGVSPQQYLTNLRMRAVCKALCETELPVQDVASLCGFSNRNYFFKLFREQFGQTPADYRADRREDAVRERKASPIPQQPISQMEDGRKLLVSSFGRIHHYRTVPKRIVCLDYASAEIIAALGAQGSIAGLAEAEESLEDCLPELRERLIGIPLLTQQSVETRVPSYEMIRACQPELVVGTAYSFREQSGIADTSQFERDGMHVYALKATYTLNSTLEDVYEDIENLGRILDREREASSVVAAMREEAMAIPSGIPAQPVRVFVFDDVLGERVFTCGQSIENHLIGKAGGINIFGNIPRQFALVDWRDVVAADPEVILVHSFYGIKDGDRKRNFLRQLPSLLNVSAVKNNRLFTMGIKYAFPGIGNVTTIRQMMRWFDTV